MVADTCEYLGVDSNCYRPEGCRCVGVLVSRAPERPQAPSPLGVALHHSIEDPESGEALVEVLLG